MAGAFPTLTDGQTVQYPLVMHYQCSTRVHRTVNASEQRYVVRAPMVRIGQTYTCLTTTDMASIDTHVSSQKGQFDSTWTIAINGITYTAMRLMSDAIQWTEDKPARWSTQFESLGFVPAPASPPATFPAFDSGAITSRPWMKRRTWETVMSEVVDSGQRHATALRNGGLTGFSNNPIRAWDVRAVDKKASEVQRIADFFLSVYGRFGSFSFTDPDTAVTYTGCRFSSDELEVRHEGYNRSSTVCTIEKS